MTKEALTLALEALTYIYTETTADEDELIDQAITAIKEALAQPKQPEQDPVAWLYERDTQGICTEFSFSRFDTEGRKGWNETPLYTTPPQNTWAGLTDRDINELWISLHDDFGNPPSATGYGRGEFQGKSSQIPL